MAPSGTGGPNGAQKGGAGAQARITDLLTTPLHDLGLDLEAVDLVAAGKRRLVRVAVDRDGGIDMDDVAEASREVSRLLDESDVMGEQPWTLEVTSRGVDRPLTHPRHWRRNVGRLVKVAFDEDRAPVTGRIVGSDDDTAHLRLEGQPDRTPLEVAYADVETARVQVEFNRKED